MSPEVDPAIAAIFGPPPEDVDLDESSVRQNNAAVIILLVLASIAVILRFVARTVQRSGLKSDDWTIIVALLTVAGTAGLSITGSTFGAGKHVWSVTLPNLTRIFQILYAYTFVYAAACSVIKLSILLFYQRVFKTEDRFFNWSIYFGYFLSLSYPLIIWITMANCCRPVSFYWNQFSGAEGECIRVEMFFLALGIINMLNDIVILSIPIPQILKLQMSTRKKAAVCGIMLLGGFVCVASIVRIFYLDKFSKAVDITWLMGPVFIWSAIEPSVAIVSACLPHLAPLRHVVKSKLSSTFGSNKSDPTPDSAPWRSGGSGSQKRGTLFTYGGTRFNFGGEGKMQKLVETDDEIGLTSRVTAQPSQRKSSPTGSGSDGGIVVESTFAQSTSRDTRES